MKTFLILFAVVGLIGLGLWLKHRGVFGKEESEATFLATPDELINIIAKNNVDVAQFFFEKKINRDAGEGFTEYCGKLSLGSSDRSMGKITTYDDIPQTMFYEFYNKNQFEAFFEELKRNESAVILEHNDSTGKHQAYKLKDVVFVQVGYKMDNTYNAEIFSAAREIVIKQKLPIAHKDSLTLIKKDSSVTAINSSPKLDSCLSTFRSGYFEGEAKNTDLTFSDRNGDMFHFEGTMEMTVVEGEAKLYSNKLTVVAGNAKGDFFLYNNCKKLVIHLTKPDTASYVLNRK